MHVHIDYRYPHITLLLAHGLVLVLFTTGSAYPYYQIDIYKYITVNT